MGFFVDCVALLATAVAQLRRAPPITLAEVLTHWPPEGKYFHEHRRSGGQTIYHLNQPSPPLRCNCGGFPRTPRCRSPQDEGAFEELIAPTVPDLALIAGWPASAVLPTNIRAAGRILGNSVVPGLAAFMARLVRSACLQADILRKVTGAHGTGPGPPSPHGTGPGPPRSPSEIALSILADELRAPSACGQCA